MRKLSLAVPARPRVHRGAALIAALLVVAAALPAGARSPTPDTLPPTPAPVLTFAPLVTLPPVNIPAPRDTAAIEDGYSIGLADAPVEIEVWEDFQCPYCLRWTYQVEPQVIAELVKTGKARLTFRTMAFLGEESRWASVAADLAAEQNLFWPFHDVLFANQLGENVGSYGIERLLTAAKVAGLDMERFTAGLTLDAARERYALLEAASTAGATAAGVSATPSVVVNGVLLESPDFDSIAAAVNAAIGGATTASPSPAASASAAP